MNVQVHDSTPRGAKWLTRVSATASVLAVVGLVLYIMAVNVIQRALILDLQGDLRDHDLLNERLVDELRDGSCPDGYERDRVWLNISDSATSPSTLTQASICVPIYGGVP